MILLFSFWKLLGFLFVIILFVNITCYIHHTCEVLLKCMLSGVGKDCSYRQRISYTHCTQKVLCWCLMKSDLWLKDSLHSLYLISLGSDVNYLVWNKARNAAEGTSCWPQTWPFSRLNSVRGLGEWVLRFKLIDTYLLFCLWKWG